jgi:uncharacterized protein (TIGR02246 family)
MKSRLMQLMGAVLLISLSMLARAGTEDDVRAADDKRHQGLSTNNMELWTSVMADDVVYIHSSGIMDIGKDLLTAPFKKGELKIKSFAREVMRVRVINDSLAQVIGKGTPTVVRGDKEMSFDLIYTSTWVKGADGWKMAHWQATRLPQK